MIFFSILVAVAADRFMQQFHELRQFNWLQAYVDWMSDVLSVQRLPQWVGSTVLIAPLLLAVWFLQGIFANGLWGLFDFAFNVVVLFFCLGPKDLDRQVDDYLDSLNMNDQSMQTHAAMQLTENNPSDDMMLQVKLVVEAIFTRANRALFAVLFWFVVLGPMGAVIYRSIDLLKDVPLKSSDSRFFSAQYNLLLAILEWLPARITVAAFMLSGNFEAALSGYKKAADEVIELGDANQAVLKTAGLGAIQFQSCSDTPTAIEQVKKARGLILRTLVIWLLVTLLVSAI